ncbi:MAG: hypothetical protein ACRD2U_08790 [Terriglobales bacterium]
MNLTKENKLDVLSGTLAVLGIVLMLAASELSLEFLMELGAAIVVMTAGVRFWVFRSSQHSHLH